MPRIAKNEQEKGLIATRKWRTNLKSKRRPEVDAVDTALATAVSVYMHTASKASSERDLKKVTTLEIMAINWLMSAGYSRVQSERVVRRRVRRLDVENLLPKVGIKQHRLPPLLRKSESLFGDFT